MKKIQELPTHPKILKFIMVVKDVNKKLTPFLPLINSSLVIACAANILVSSFGKDKTDDITIDIDNLRYENEELRREISSVRDQAEEASSKADDAQTGADDAKSDVDDLERKLTLGVFN